MKKLDAIHKYDAVRIKRQRILEQYEEFKQAMVDDVVLELDLDSIKEVLSSKKKKG